MKSKAVSAFLHCWGEKSSGPSKEGRLGKYPRLGGLPTRIDVFKLYKACSQPWISSCPDWIVKWSTLSLTASHRTWWIFYRSIISSTAFIVFHCTVDGILKKLPCKPRDQTRNKTRQYRKGSIVCQALITYSVNYLNILVWNWRTLGCLHSVVLWLICREYSCSVSLYICIIIKIMNTHANSGLYQIFLYLWI